MPLLGAALVLVFAQAVAPTSPDDEVLRLVDRGVELRLSGNDEGALEVLRHAERLKPTPRGRAQLAFAEQALGLWREAEEHLQLASAVTTDPWIAKQRDPIAGALRTIAGHLGTLEVRGGDGAELFVDGKSLGRLPGTKPWRVEVGTHRLEARADGYYPVTREIEITAGGRTRETLSLSPMQRTAGPAGSNGAGPVPPPDSAPAPARDGASTWPRTLGFGMAGVGVAGVALGVTSVFVSNGHATDYNDNPACGRANEPSACTSNASDTRVWRNVAIASFVAGGALLAGGIALVVITPRATSAVAVRANPWGGSLEARF